MMPVANTMPARPRWRLPIPARLHVRLLTLAGCWLVVIAMFVAMTRVADRAVLNEIRAQARGTAIALAAGMNAEELASIQGPADRDRPAFRRIQDLIDAVSANNPDVRYIYVMRRDPTAGAPQTAYVYVVDERERDRNGNGVIDPEEVPQLPGTPYDATDFPAMVEAWQRPAADEAITADPPYPDSISGYAPVRDATGRTVAIVGVDVLADTVTAKQRAVRWTAWSLALAVNALLTFVLVLYRKQHLALEHNLALSRELKNRNRQLTLMNQHYEEELKLAQDVQLGLLPRELPRHSRLSFDRCFVTCAMLGGDLYDAFELDDDLVALYVADVAGHGASAALISGLVKMAAESIKSEGVGADRRMLRPGAALARINQMVGREIPADKFVTIVFAVIDLRRSVCRLASAGHPPPALVSAAERTARMVSAPTGPAIGLLEHSEWPETECSLSPHDKLCFFTDGITEAMNAAREEFGEQRLLELLSLYAAEPTPVLIERLSRALADHRGAHSVSDDYTLLIAEMT